MRRDMDLVRTILLVAESETDRGYLSVDGYDESLVAGHVRMMEEAGLVEAKLLGSSESGFKHAKIHRLTWAGHEFLDSIRSDRVWSETKTTLAKTIGDASLEVVKTVATGVSLRLLGL